MTNQRHSRASFAHFARSSDIRSSHSSSPHGSSWGSRSARYFIGGALALGFFAGEAPALADGVPRAEVRVIHATKCADKSVDPRIGDAPPSLGYECMKLVETKMMPLVVNQPSTTGLPNGRTFQLLHTGKADNRYKVTASISPADGSAGFVKLADITAEPNKPFNVGGFSHQGGVLLLSVRIIP